MRVQGLPGSSVGLLPMSPTAAAAARRASTHAARAGVAAVPSFDAVAAGVLPPARQGAVPPYAPVMGPEAWLASDFPDQEVYTVRLSDLHASELEAAACTVLASGRVRAKDNRLEGVTDLTAADFSLPTLGPLLRATAEDIASGRGFALLRRLPVERWSREEALVAYWGLGLHWGVPMTQNEKGHLIGHVKDVGIDPENSNPNTRIYMTRAAQPWHVDSADAVALLCLAEAKEGGDSAFASSTAIINAIREEEPELLPVLAGPWYLDRKGEVGPGQEPVFEQPILHYHRGRVLVSFHDTYYQLAAAKWGGAAALSAAQLRALEKFREVAERPGVAIRMRLAPGDVQLLTNHTIVHTRSAYKDWQGEDGSARHLLRLWLASPPPLAVPLPDSYRHLFKRWAADDRGLVRRADGSWAAGGAAGFVPIEAEVGQASIPPASVEATEAGVRA